LHTLGRLDSDELVNTQDKIVIMNVSLEGNWLEVVDISSKNLVKF